jgi:hypothetical protein
MKKPKRTEEERKAERHERAKKTLYMTRLIPNADHPRAIAKYLFHEFSESRSRGTWLIRNAIGRYEDQRFIGEMLKALGGYLLKGQPIYDEVEFDIADMLNRLPITTPVPNVASKLKKLHPRYTIGALERRVRRFKEPLLKLL